MSNTPQQQINVGETINDGTGEGLREAFQAVNNNFANIWAAGPVDSQVVISGNKVSTGETNLDLLLAGNGIGNIDVASTVLPTISNVYDIGSNTLQFSEIHAQYFYGNGRYLTGISGGGGGGSNVTFSLGPPENPSIGDIWIESDTGVQYIYFNDDTSSQWAEMEAYQSFSDTNGNANVDFTAITSNVTPAVANTFSLGNISKPWKDLYLSQLLYFGNTAIGLVGNTLQVNGDNVVVITGNTANIGNFVFNGNNLQNLNGGSFNNGDLSHGPTSGFNVAPNGSGTAAAFNTYGNIILQTGDSGVVSKTWTFDIYGNITLPTNSSSINYANGQPYGGSGAQGTTGAQGTAGVQGATGAQGTAGAGGVPGGSNTQIQFNNSGAFGGSANLTYNTTTKTLTADNVSLTNLYFNGTGAVNIESGNDLNLSAVGGVSINAGNVTVSGSGGISIPNLPAFRVYGNGVTNISTTTNTTGVLNGNNWAVDYNQGSYLNSTTGTFTAPIAGLYQVNLNMRVANNTAATAQALVSKNRATTNTVQVMWESAANPTINHFGVSTVSKLAAGDTLNLVVTVGALTFDANDSWSVAFLG